MTDNYPKVGVGVMIFKGGKALMQQRIGAVASGSYVFGTGGHLEHLESIEDCAKRECREEAGIEIGNISFLCLTNVTTYAPKHYVDIGLTADWVSGEPRILEPDKCASWGWYDLDNLPKPLSGWSPNYLEAYKTGKRFFDS